MSPIQLKLAGALAGLAVLLAGVAAVATESGLRERERARVERSLAERGRLVAELVERLGLDAEPVALDALAQSAARAAGARVTLIDPDGAVVVDSNVALDDVPGVENHADRPEVAAALRGEPGSSTRHSRTVGRDLLYYALPLPSGGIARLAIDLGEVDAAVAHLRRRILTGGALGLLIAIGAGLLLASRLERDTLPVQRTLAALRRGDLAARVGREAGDEMRDVASAVDQLADAIEARIGELRGEKGQLQAVLSGMVEGVLVVDHRERIVLANPRLRELFELPEDVEGTSPVEAIRHAELEALLHEAASGDERVARELDFKTPRPRTVRVHAASFASDSGPGVVAVFHDVTEMRRLEAARRDFVANVSHELRTPLAAIHGFTETLVGRELPAEDRQRYLGILHEHSKRLGQLIEDLLELSQIESGRMELENVPIDVRAAAEAVVNRHRPRFEERSIAVEVVPGDSPLARGDPRALDHVLGNLLDNACKYTEPGGSVRIRISSAPGTVQVEVEDDGIGIPRDDRSRIFERFYRVDKARSRELGGTGLGLAIVRHLVESIGGRVSVESTPGEGSTFRVELVAAS